MDSVSTRAFLNYMLGTKDGLSLVDGFKAWQFGKSFPLQIIKDVTNSFFEGMPLLPCNAPEIICCNNAHDVRMLQQHFYCEVSKVAVIPYPDGANWLERIWEAFFISATLRTLENVEVDKIFVFEMETSGNPLPFKIGYADEINYTHKFSSFAAKLWLLPVSLFDGITATCDVAIHFSVKYYTGVYNRFSHYYDSTSFCRIQFQFPHIKLDDMIFGRCDGVDDKEAVQRQILSLVVSSVCAGHSQTPANAEELWKSERFLKYQFVAEFVRNYLGADLNFCGQTWKLVSCNIAGALKFSYMYTSHEPSDLAGEIFTNTEAFRDKTKKMLPALRLALMNSTCVMSCCLAQGCSVSVVPDIVVMKEDIAVALNDGCGWISEDAAQALFASYCENWFEAADVGAADPEHRSSVLEAQFTELSVPELNAKWPSDDLPPAAHFPAGYIPSAFQIRYRGFKGMLVVNKELTGNTIQFTRSMLKFESTIDQHIFVVGVSQPAPPTVLSSELVIMFEGCSSKQVALFEYLRRFVVDERIDNANQSLVSLMRNPRTFLKYMKVEDDIIERCCGEYPDAHLSQLPVFASRILSLNAPLPNSAHLYGVADFSRTLLPDEVFLCIPGLFAGASVVITKTPALRKSDLRVYKAVIDRAELNHLRDVVVFSTRSDDLASNQLSNADLDGDHFYIMWDPQLIRLLDLAEVARRGQGLGACQSDSCPVIEVTAQGTSGGNKEIWSRCFEEVKTALREPANSFTHCSLQHLLCLRRVFLDEAGADWPHSKTAQDIAGWLNKTFEAPKHGKWLGWDTVREQLGAVIPRFPHYYLGCAFDTPYRRSSSLYARLYEALWAILLDHGKWEADPCGGCARDDEEPLMFGQIFTSALVALDSVVRSKIEVTPDFVYGLDDVFLDKGVDTRNPLNWVKADGIPNDRVVLFETLTVTAPLFYAVNDDVGSKRTNHQFARLVSAPYNVGAEMLRDEEYEGLVEYFTSGAEEINPMKLFSRSLGTPRCYDSDGHLRCARMLSFLVLLPKEPELWSRTQRDRIKKYLEQKVRILCFFGPTPRKTYSTYIEATSQVLSKLGHVDHLFVHGIKQALEGTVDAPDDGKAVLAMAAIDRDVFSA
jgi:hypothetical protein